MTSRGPRVSVHGGHSAEFCSHARDRLEAIVEAYASAGFAWVGLTEHMPAASDAFVPPEEREAGLDASAMLSRFEAYFATARRLQAAFAGRLRVFVAFEAEVYSGATAFAARLRERFAPDYIVGSVHHVHDVMIDSTHELWDEAAKRAGGIEALYCDYFDAQHEMLRALRPEVVAHFDLVRLLDPAYPERLCRPDVAARIRRNLEVVRDLGSVLDLNVRAFAKGQSEPYPSAPVLEQARSLGVLALVGDDSHGVSDVGVHVDEGLAVLAAHGFDPYAQLPLAGGGTR